MITRREFLKFTSVAGAGMLFPGAIKLAGVLAAPELGASPVLPKYVDALPLPGTMHPSGTLNGLPLYTVTLRPCQQKVHRDVPVTNFWGYNGTTPGASFDVNTGEPMYVKWVNALPTTHLLAASIDNTIPGMAGQPQVRATVHTHGAEVPFTSDGVFTSNGGFSSLLPGQSATYYYPNIQRGATIWYHDHALGIDRLNVMVGLAGFYIIRDPVEAALNLPSGAFEIPIVIQDREVDAAAQLVYPTVGDNPAIHPQWVPEFFGDTAVVNGKVYPPFGRAAEVPLQVPERLKRQVLHPEVQLDAELLPDRNGRRAPAGARRDEAPNNRTRGARRLHSRFRPRTGSAGHTQ
jgi:FtsP/CotA-like multicopper oxidase with cupredoxin domain